MRTTIFKWVLAGLGLLAAGSAPFTEAAGDPSFCNADSLVVLEGETRQGDLYFFSQNVDISGTYDGDLIGGTHTAVINGVVTGDVAIAGRTLDIRGEVRDSVRFTGESLNITGTVDGDILFFGGQLNVHPQARITGNVMAYGGSAFVEGDVGGRVTFGGGQVSISGPVAGGASITADTVRVLPTARILGDFDYTTRKEIEFPDDTVAGEVLFKEDVQDDDKDDDDSFVGGLLWWGWYTLAALLVGLISIALLRRATPALVAPISREGMLVTLVGLGIFLVVPAASVLAIALIISLPLGVIALVLFFIGLYLAKLPVAIWLGQRVLGLFGMSTPSPFLALAVGLVLLYLLFEIPFFIGTLIYLVTVWLGLGAFVMSVRGYLSDRNESLPAAAAE